MKALKKRFNVKRFFNSMTAEISLLNGTPAVIQLFWIRNHLLRQAGDHIAKNHIAMAVVYNADLMS